MRCLAQQRAVQRKQSDNYCRGSDVAKTDNETENCENSNLFKLNFHLRMCGVREQKRLQCFDTKEAFHSLKMSHLRSYWRRTV